MKIILSLLLINLQVAQTTAQHEVEMADALRAEGKIYVIVLIILIVLAGMFAYLFMLDRKVKKLEDRLK